MLRKQVITTVAPGVPAQQVQVVYSQAFEDVPDQWELPVAGSIGLGTIKGTVGVVKTNNKVRRGIVAWPTAVPQAPEGRTFLKLDKVDKRDAAPFVILPPGNNDGGVVVREEEQRGLEKRNAKGDAGSNGSSSAAGRVVLGAGPPTLALLIALVACMVI
ncbi:hypothetical protein GJ744_002288 [Endocarpon pusillum]|uniref:Uncharacterized protein n=1 Tax=Endocarpon pusillum TaxID=364733 RepID=A0A8H7E9W7_9EURO|nr:hypothetical protein GJ744_002288 [Endocarpon pusillum]